MRSSIALTLVLFLTACGASATDVARATLDATGEAVKTVDTANAQAMNRVRDTWIAEAETREAFQVRAQPFENLRTAINIARRLLYAIEAAVDAGSADSLTAAAPCILSALNQILLGLEEVNRDPDITIGIPSELTTAVQFFMGVGGTCPSDALAGGTNSGP